MEYRRPRARRRRARDTNVVDTNIVHRTQQVAPVEPATSRAAGHVRRTFGPEGLDRRVGADELRSQLPLRGVRGPLQRTVVGRGGAVARLRWGKSARRRPQWTADPRRRRPRALDQRVGRGTGVRSSRRRPHGAQVRNYATGTPSKIATFTPRRASSARKARGWTTPPSPCTPGVVRTSAGSAPAIAAVVSASTVPAAVAVRSIAPNTTGSRAAPRVPPHLDAQCAPLVDRVTPARPRTRRLLGAAESNAGARETRDRVGGSSSSPFATGSHARASTGLKPHESSPPRLRSSVTTPSRSSAPRSPSATRNELALASPAAPSVRCSHRRPCRTTPPRGAPRRRRGPARAPRQLRW